MTGPARAGGDKPPTEGDEPPMTDGAKLARSALIGVMLGSGLFLILRMVFDVDVDPALIAGAFVGVSGGMMHRQATAGPPTQK